MSRNSFPFFATKNDLLQVLNDANYKVPYVSSILKDCEEVKVYELPEEIEELSAISIGDQNHSDLYLLINRDEQPKTRTVKQRRGGVKHFYDQLSHPTSVTLRAGGLLKDSRCIIAGQVGTLSVDTWSVALYKAIFFSVKKRFTKIESFYVGDEAAKKLDDGYRLTVNVRSPVDYDLKR